MIFFDVIILGFYFIYKNLYYQNDHTFLGSGANDHSFYTSMTLHSFLSISILTYIDKMLFNMFFGIYIWIFVFIFFFIFLFWFYIIKDRLEKILSKEYSKSIKLRYSIFSVFYAALAFILFFKTIW
jgi:hypothetical protein